MLGFLLSTFLFLAAFMYLGRYRKHVAIWGTSAVVTVLCGVLFLRFAYVSLPRGDPPFDRVTDIYPRHARRLRAATMSRHHHRSSATASSTA